MSGIFICYRREDNRHAAGRLYECLQRHFPAEQIFLDIDTIEPGIPFRETIQERLSQAKAILVVIGPGWLGGGAIGARRIDAANDFVRMEVEEGLKLGIRVVPVLIDGAAMPPASDLPESPKRLTERHAFELGHHRFQRDADLLAEALTKLVTKRPRSEWRAVFVKFSQWGFVARLSCGSENHTLSLYVNMNGFAGPIKVDDVPISDAQGRGRKEVGFQISDHAENFLLKFETSFWSQLIAAEIWIGDRRILTGKR